MIENPLSILWAIFTLSESTAIVAGKSTTSFILYNGSYYNRMHLAIIIYGAF